MHSTRICMYESTRFYFKLVTINLTFLGTHALTSCCLWQSCCCGTIPVLKTSLRVFFLRLNLRSNCSNRLNACPLLTTRSPPWTTSYFSVWCCRLFSSLRMSIADTLARLDETSSSSLSSSSSSAERRYLPTSHEYMLCEVLRSQITSSWKLWTLLKWYIKVFINSFFLFLLMDVAMNKN